MNNFKIYAYDLLQEEYTLQQIENCVETLQMDFLMDDWDDVVKQLNTMGCDNCGEEFQN
jgi:hypothetical protein